MSADKTFEGRTAQELRIILAEKEKRIEFARSRIGEPPNLDFACIDAGRVRRMLEIKLEAIKIRRAIEKREGK